jgi:cyclopropane fatty-acyl-phospholipid synthase-like methyltransferase
MTEFARLYDELAWIWPLFSPAEEYEEEVRIIVDRFAELGVHGGSLLHLGSGGGSIDFHLKRHFRITGVDLSPGMRREAQTINPEVEYVHGDIRSVRLGRFFDAVLVHDAIAYMTSQDELRAAYGTAAAHLRPGGALVAQPEEVRERYIEKESSQWTITRGDTTVTAIELVTDPDPDDTEFLAAYFFLVQEGDRFSTLSDLHRVGIFPLDDFVSAIRAAGFHAHAGPWPPPDEDGVIWPPLITGVRTA